MVSPGKGMDDQERTVNWLGPRWSQEAAKQDGGRGS